MSFFNKLVDGFTEHNQGQGQNQQQQQQQQQQKGPPPQPPQPWRAEWDEQRNCWIFINQQTGQRSHEFPQSEYGGGQYNPGCNQQYGGQQQFNQAPPQGQYGAPAGAPSPKKQGMGYGSMALAAGAGLAGGALLMHEGEKVGPWSRYCSHALVSCYLRWNEDKDRFENGVGYDRNRFEDRVDYEENRVEDRLDYGANRFEDIPDDAARWGGRKVQEVEDIPQEIDNKWDNAVDAIEDVPDCVAGFFGREAGKVDRFDDDIQDSYDQGRDEERYDDTNDNY